MTSDLLNIIWLAVLGGVVGLLGGVVFLLVGSLSEWLSIYSVPFAAGVLITVALIGLLPEMFEVAGEEGLLVVLLSFFGVFLFEQFACSLHHHDDHGGDDDGYGQDGTSVILVMVGDTIHNFIDGVAIAAAYLVDPGLGLATAISSLLHEIPHEIGDFGLFLKAGLTKRRVFLLNFLSALFTIAGALVVYFMNLDKLLIGNLLAVAAGMFLYLGASDFLPEINKGKFEKKTILVLLLGVLIMYGVLSIVPHTH